MSDRKLLAIVTWIGGQILLLISAGPLVALGVSLCMFSHVLNSDVPDNGGEK